jgi:hypothetical protein
MSHELYVIKVILLPNVVVVDDKVDALLSLYGVYRWGVKNGSFETVGSFEICACSHHHLLRGYIE